METVELFKQYLEQLFAGKRTGARELLFDAHDRGFGADRLLSNIIWPAMEQIDKLHRDGHITAIVEHMATRINRMVADQLHSVLNRRPKDGRRIVVFCGADEAGELGAQISSDLFEADGWSVWFVGAGIANDDALRFLGDITPDVLLIYGSLPPEVPGVRKLIALIREVGVCENMQIMVCGGVYGRVEELAEEIKADLCAKNIREAMVLAEKYPDRIPREDAPEPGRRRKRKRKVQNPRVGELRRELGIEESLEQEDSDEMEVDADVEEEIPTPAAVGEE
ncbi:MAG: B12-binding domain-containing protein [Phycisphaerae bacterium]|nr:B12-binding domain-containing protein [Phycisphaerae bacterium]